MTTHQEKTPFLLRTHMISVIKIRDKIHMYFWHSIIFVSRLVDLKYTK